MPTEEALHKRALTRAIRVIDAQGFKEEQLVRGTPYQRSVSGKARKLGRWGGRLEGDWDSAIHVVIELVLPGEAAKAKNGKPAKGKKQAGSVALGSARKGLGVENLLEHVHRLLDPGLTREPDTLRINYLALMVLMRAAADSASPSLSKIAAQSWATIFEDEKPVPFAELGGALRDARLRKRLLRFVEDRIDELSFGPRPRQRDARLTWETERLAAELRAFVTLAALPIAKFPREDALGERLEQLYERAAGDSDARGTGGDWPPLGFFLEGSPIVTALYFAASRMLGAGGVAYDDALTVSDLDIEAFVPRGSSVRKLLVSLGTVPQAKDLLSGLGLLAIPRPNLDTDKAATWQDFLSEAGGPQGLYCYLPFTTGIAVAALLRYVDASGRGSEELRASITRSLAAVRGARVRSGRTAAYGLPFAPYSVYNELLATCLFLLDEEARPKVANQWRNLVPAVRYMLACQATNGLFQEQYGGNEIYEGEVAGCTLRALAEFAELVAKPASAALLGIDQDERKRLALDVGESIERAVRGFLDAQNTSGGFATWSRTEREKHGLLGTDEGPGAQDVFIFDAAAADSTGWSLEGLCSVAPRGKLRPGISLNPSTLADLKRGVERGVDWLRRDFHREAGWWARYGGAYVTGTQAAVRGLRAAGVSLEDPVITRARYLLVRAQNEDGGWGQDLEADDRRNNRAPRKVAMVGESCAELTGVALVALLDAGASPNDDAVMRGVHYLLDPKQIDDKGHWKADIPAHSFMQGWYYRDQMHADMRPAEALLRWCQARASA